MRVDHEPLVHLVAHANTRTQRAPRATGSTKPLHELRRRFIHESRDVLAPKLRRHRRQQFEHFFRSRGYLSPRYRRIILWL